MRWRIAVGRDIYNLSDASEVVRNSTRHAWQWDRHVQTTELQHAMHEVLHDRQRLRVLRDVVVHYEGQRATLLDDHAVLSEIHALLRSGRVVAVAQPREVLPAREHLDGIIITPADVAEPDDEPVTPESPPEPSPEPLSFELFAFVVPDENFRLERVVWLPAHADPTPDEPNTAAASALQPGLALAAAVWGYAREHPERKVVVAGHTDKSGSDEFNEALSRLRAEQVKLFLAGAHTAWADHAQQHARVDDLQAALLWVASAFEVDSDPGKLDNDWGPATSSALQRFRSWYEVTLGLPRPQTEQAGSGDWLAIVHCYDLAVRRALTWTSEDLKDARRCLKWHGSYPVLACGESFPAQSPGTGSAAEDRRVEVIFADAAVYPGNPGSPAGAALYDDARYQWNWLEADELWLELGTPTKNDVHLRLLSNSGRHHLASCDCELETPSGIRSVTTDAEGQLCVQKVDPGYHVLRVRFGDQSFETTVPSVAAGTGPYLHRVSGARFQGE